MQNFETPIKNLIDRRTRIKLELLKYNVQGEHTFKGIDLKIDNPFKWIDLEPRRRLIEIANKRQKEFDKIGFGIAEKMKEISEISQPKILFSESVFKGFSEVVAPRVELNIGASLKMWEAIQPMQIQMSDFMESVSKISDFSNVFKQTDMKNLFSTVENMSSIAANIELPRINVLDKTNSAYLNMSYMQTRSLFYKVNRINDLDIEPYLDQDEDIDEKRTELLRGVYIYGMFFLIACMAFPMAMSSSSPETIVDLLSQATLESAKKKVEELDDEDQ